MSAPPPDLASCVQGAVRGDVAAAQALVEHCQPLVLRLVRAHLPRSLGEEDLVQEVFLKMFTRIASYAPRDGIPFEHWLSRLAVNTCLDALRAERRRPRPQPLDADGGEARWPAWMARSAAPGVEDALAARELAEALLAHLPARDRLLLTLLDLEQRDAAEVAQLTGWNRTLIKVRAFRARRRLRAVAARLQGGEEP